MNVIKRWSEIEKLLEDNNGFCTVIELSDRLGVSLATIRRDLTEMEEQKVIKRIHGGAKLLPKEDFKRVGSVFSRIQDNYESKIIIGEFAAKLIKNNSFVFLDSSSTVSAMIPYITAENITVVTNSFYAAPQLVDAKITTILLPGRLQSNMQIASEETLGTLRHYYFDYAFLGVYGLSLQNGFTGYNPMDCELKKIVIHNTKNCYTLADTSKFERKAFYSYAEHDAMPIITDGITEHNIDFEKLILAR